MRNAIRVSVLSMAVLGLAMAARAQATAQSKAVWDQATADLATANAYTYRYYPDGSTTPSNFNGGVTCTGTASPFACQALFPAFTPGASHTMYVTSANAAGESLKSNTLTFTFIVVPSAPTNFRILP